MVRVVVLEWGVAPEEPPDINWRGEHPAWEDRQEGILAPKAVSQNNLNGFCLTYSCTDGLPL
jgi:hypothetical protein